jgi:phage portal protein BeeE
MEPEQSNNLKVAVIGVGGQDRRIRSLKSVSDLEQLIASETNQMSTEDYYGAVATLYRCVVHIANAVASMPRQIENAETGEVIAQGNFPQPELDPVGKPYTEDAIPFKIRLNRLLWQTTTSLQLRAEAFWHREGNLLRTTAVVWQDPKLIKPKRDAYGITHFEKHLRGRAPLPIPVEDMTYFYIPGLRENHPGVAPAQVALHDAGIIYHQNAFLERFFENGAMPTTLFFMDGAEPGPEEKNRMKRFLYSVMTGRLRAWGIELLSRKLHFEHLVPPLKEMVLPQLRTEAQYAICVAMGVPISVIYTNASRNSTSEQDDLHFYTKTILPFLHDIEETANEDLFLPNGLRLRFRPDRLEVFEALEVAKLQELAVVKDDLLINERRAAAGYPAIEAAAEDEVDSIDDQGETAVKHLPFDMTQAEYELMQRDLALWESKVLKRLGKLPPASVSFDSLFIPPPVSELVQGQLLRAENGQEVKAAFAAPFRLFRRDAPPRSFTP